MSQSLGAFRRGGDDISPLYVFLEATNEGARGVGIVRVHVGVGTNPVYEGPFEGDLDLPGTLAPGGSARFWVRAKTLAASLERAGHGGRPLARFVVEGAEGERGEKAFRFRVEQYLQLEDE